ncbi:hypothetical protein [Nocardia wallacei]|uniref:hypothetical protein n=1 Tax=Nocardia wallacei TaxID=480035 RepID=UPI002458188E|nr:hypothetical protein [Nocardia wallacei]
MKLRSVTSVCAAALIGAIATILTPTPQAHAENLCGFAFTGGQPYVQHGAVLVGGYADCTTPPDEFSISLTLVFSPRRGGGEFTTRAAEDSRHKIPNPRLNIATWAQCEPGLWRGIAAIWETSSAGYHTYSVHTPVTIISC